MLCNALALSLQPMLKRGWRRYGNVLVVALLMTLLFAEPASAAAPARFAHCHASGGYKTDCTAKGMVQHPLHIYVQIFETVRPIVYAWTDTCILNGHRKTAKGSHGIYRSGHKQLIRKPFLHPDSCVVSVDAINLNFEDATFTAYLLVSH